MNCPLKYTQKRWSAAEEGHIGGEEECCQENCAWWNEYIGKCSITVLAQAASMIEGQVRGTW